MYLKSYSSSNAREVIFSKARLSRGGKIFFAFLLLEYVFPLFINLIIDTQPIFRLPLQSPAILFTILILILVSILGLLFGSLTPSIIPRNDGPIKPIPKWMLILFSLFTILVGGYIFISGLTQWRYTTSISNNNLVFYASVAQILMPSLIFWVLITDHQLILSRSKNDFFVKFLMLIGLIFSINGFGSMVVTLLFLLVFIASKSALGFLFNEPIKKNKNLFKYISLPILALFFAAPIIELGSFAKTGNRTNITEILSVHTEFNYLVNRHSVHLSSLAASIEDGSDISNMKIPFETAAYRLKRISGLDPQAEKPEISSFARLALLQFADFENINPKGGSSPGLLASLTMVLPLPFAIIGIFLIIFFMVKFIDFVMCRQPLFSWTGAFIFAYVPLRNFTDSPLDLFIPGPVTILLALIVLLSLRREKLEK